MALLKRKIEEAQKLLRDSQIDGWLLYDFHRQNPLALDFLELNASHLLTRRFFYWIPALGEPVKIVHAIEAKSSNISQEKSTSTCTGRR